MNVKKAVEVTITSDLMCPWCWIGLRKLQQASRETKIPIQVKWKPFQLGPNIPEEGKLKGGTPASRVGDHLASQGQSVGIKFTGLTDRTPNTALFHATIKYLQDVVTLSSETVTEFHEVVFEGYFTLGIFPNQEGILNVSKKVKDAAVHDHVANLYKNPSTLSQLMKGVAREARDARHRGVDGVPTFAFGGDSNAFSGAQPVATFVQYLERYAD